MTTKVTVDAHAGWPVEVTQRDESVNGTGVETKTIVSPMTTQDFFVWQGHSITVKEMPQ